MPATLGVTCSEVPVLTATRLGIDTYRLPIVYMRADNPVCRSEGFEAHTRVRVCAGNRTIVAVLNVVTTSLLEQDEAGFSNAAWDALALEDGQPVQVGHAPPLESFGRVRAKMHGVRFEDADWEAVVQDIAASNYADVHLASFLTVCANDALNVGEMIGLTRAMIGAGSRLSWPAERVVDKHCVGGLPGNRTTPIVVAIVAAAGLVIPKTSSRAITSPAGTADVMETVTRVDLTLDQMRAVVETHGGCLAWGGSVALSPADDALVRVERALDIDGQGQLIASVLSKKAAAGATHVVIDIPWGPTAKFRSHAAASRLRRDIEEVGEAIGLKVQAVLSDGTAPVGRGIGPALEARDVLQVLRRSEHAPVDLRERAVFLAGQVLELGDAAPSNRGAQLAAEILDDGRAYTKFAAICEAQGGLFEPPIASHIQPVLAPQAGTVTRFDNRSLARVAKLAGAPIDKAAGLELHVGVGDRVEEGQPLFTIHAESPGELIYARAWLDSHDLPILLGDAP